MARITARGLSPVEYLVIASTAKGVASVITYPHEVLRTRFREQRGADRRYTGIIQAFRLIAKEEGVAGLYGGLGPHLLKVPRRKREKASTESHCGALLSAMLISSGAQVIPNAAIMFLTYEVVVDMLVQRL